MEFIVEVSEIADISWWVENRKKLNEAIRYYNQYMEGTRNRETVLAKAIQIKAYGEQNTFAYWQLQMLDDIIDRVQSRGVLP